MNFETKLWRIGSLNGGGFVQITQKASGAVRTVPRSTFHSSEALALMPELWLNKICRDAFRGARDEGYHAS